MRKRKDKSRSFSIYLLKQGYNVTNTLLDENKDDIMAGTNLPEGSQLRVLRTKSPAPWWKEYFGISGDLKQVSNGALVFLPVDDRWFVLSFGRAYHHINDAAYEHDFGLYVVLNAVDSEKLTSIDTTEPGTASRQREQASRASDLTHFHFNSNSAILSGLKGKVRDEYKDLARHVAGSGSLRINSNMQPNALIPVCKRLLEIYRKDDWKTTFLNLWSIIPIKDPDLIKELDNKMLEAFRKEESEKLSLSVPGIVDYTGEFYFFSPGRSRPFHEEVDIQQYYEHLKDNSIDPDAVDVACLKKKHKLNPVNGDGIPQGSYSPYSIYRCLIFDVEWKDDTYHLCGGEWYKVRRDYITQLDEFLANFLKPPPKGLPEYTHGSEREYNAAVARNCNNFLCLDGTNFAPKTQTTVEPCDLYTVSGRTAIFIHVKHYTGSASLSHLFAQGKNSTKLMISEPDVRKNMENLIKKHSNGKDEATYLDPIKEGSYEIVYAIIEGRKTGKVNTLPLFSRITLRDSIRDLNSMRGVRATYCFVKNKSTKKSPPEPYRRKKKSENICNEVARRREHLNEVPL